MDGGGAGCPGATREECGRTARGLTPGHDGSLESGVLQSDSGPGHTPRLKGAQGLHALRVTHSQSRPVVDELADPWSRLSVSSQFRALSSGEVSDPKREDWERKVCPSPNSGDRHPNSSNSSSAAASPALSPDTHPQLSRTAGEASSKKFLEARGTAAASLLVGKV